MELPDAGHVNWTLATGPLHRLGARCGLVRGPDSWRLGVALGAGCWLILVLLLAAGDQPDVPLRSLFLMGAHVRLLLAIPLFFAGESRLQRKLARFTDYLAGSGIVPSGSRIALDAAIARANRSLGSPVASGTILVAALVFPLLTSSADIPWRMARTEFSDAAWAWYWYACLPLFRFLLYQWMWRLAVWWRFLWTLSRLDLRLVPAHPDHAAGLGLLATVQVGFAPLVAAVSAILAASFAMEMELGRLTLESLTPSIGLILAGDGVLFIGPLFVFMGRLRDCRAQGMADYMALAARYVREFHQKWVRPGEPDGEPLLGTPDLQSLADLASAVGVVQDMRWVPVTQRLALAIALAAMLPMLPLLLMVYPVTELLQKLLRTLAGL